MNMNIDEALSGRRSIREYVGKDVPEELVRQVHACILDNCSFKILNLA